MELLQDWEVAVHRIFVVVLPLLLPI